jgi:hypothetical protein
MQRFQKLSVLTFYTGRVKSEAWHLFQLEWIALGLTAQRFWTAPKRLISELESQARFTASGKCFAWLDRVRMGV